MTDKEKLKQLAKACLSKAHNDIPEATTRMVTTISRDDRLYKALMDPLLREACYTIISGERRQQNGIVWRTHQPTAEEVRKGMTAAAEGTMRTLYDWCLPNGTALGDATHDDLMEGYEKYSSQSKDMGIKAKWLHLVAQHVHGRQVVRKALTLDQLDALRRQASNGHGRGGGKGKEPPEDRPGL